MTLAEIKQTISEQGYYEGPVPSVPSMYYHGFAQRKGRWMPKEQKENETAKLRELVTGPGVYRTTVKPTVANMFAQKLRYQGHDVTTSKDGFYTVITWVSKDDEFKEIFSKLNLQECLAVKAILDAHVDRLTKE